mgnify:CR=1 FL=1
MAILNPTLACADILHLYRDIEEAVAGGAKMLHIDIMDGHYVPNICLSFEQAGAIRRAFPKIPMDIHLMVTEPFHWLGELDKLKPEMASFHLDATSFPLRMARSIRSLGIHAGVVLNPAQPVSLLLEILEELDYVLLMGVEPGFSGQIFYPPIHTKIRELAELRKKINPGLKIMVDGGIDFENGPVCASEGADILVGGAFVCFGQPDGIRKSAGRFVRAVETEMEETA